MNKFSLSSICHEILRLAGSTLSLKLSRVFVCGRYLVLLFMGREELEVNPDGIFHTISRFFPLASKDGDGVHR